MIRWQSRQMKCRPLGDLLTRADPQLGQSSGAITRWRVEGILDNRTGNFISQVW